VNNGLKYAEKDAADVHRFFTGGAGPLRDEQATLLVGRGATVAQVPEAIVKAPESTMLFVVKVCEPITVPLMNVPTPALEMRVVPFRVRLPAVIATLPAVAVMSPVAEVIPVAFVIAPALEISMFVVSNAKVPLPPPILTNALEVPVLMLVAKLEEVLIEVIAPEIVAPAVPVNNPSAEIAPIPVITPAVEISQSSELIEMSCPAVPPPRVMSPVEVPVAMLTSKLEEALRDTAAPVIVNPPVPWIRPVPELTPTATTLPAASTSKLEKLITAVVPIISKVVPVISLSPMERAFV
jgi:hypothetical protein